MDNKKVICGGVYLNHLQNCRHCNNILSNVVILLQYLFSWNKWNMVLTNRSRITWVALRVVELVKMLWNYISGKFRIYFKCQTFSKTHKNMKTLSILVQNWKSRYYVFLTFMQFRPIQKFVSYMSAALLGD